MKSDSSLDVLWELEVRLTETATAMERDATAKSISGPAAERLTQKAEGLRLARARTCGTRSAPDATETARTAPTNR